MTTEAKEPRSIRLNKAHREDILEAVMQQRAKTNPPPAGSTKDAFVEAILTYLMAPKKNWPAELKALTNMVKRTKQAIEFKAAIPAELRDYVKFHAEYNFRLEVHLPDGSVGAYIGFKLPIELAKKLGIPALATDGVNVALLHVSSYNTLVIPRDTPAYKTYKDGQRALSLWENEQDKVRSEIADILEQFNTTNQIREGWPEMEQYLPAHIADPVRVVQLPALTTSRLNKRLGL